MGFFYLFIHFFVCASLNPLQAPSRDDHPRQVLHVREDRGQQVGGLPGPAAGRVHRRVRGGAGGTQGCWGDTRVLAAHPLQRHGTAKRLWSS